MGQRAGPVEGVVVTGRINPQFWAGKRVFLTGHTGFKGAWLSLLLERMGAQVHGFALAPATDPALFAILAPFSGQVSALADMAEMASVQAAVKAANPDIAIHMAAQPLVRPSYLEPVATFAANVMGTLHVLEALREAPNLRVVLAVTTDKVYRNDNTGRPFGESDPLGGHDPYSASKAACEIAVESWQKSFFQARHIRVATARAGNVIGGGDFSPDRIVPDIFRAFRQRQKLVLRYPDATRPWQHVLDCLTGYLLYIEGLDAGKNLPLALNFGPDGAPMAVSSVVEAMQAALGATEGWQHDSGPHPNEAAVLALATGQARALLGWRDRLTTAQAIAQTAAWYGAFVAGRDMRAHSLDEIARHGA